MPTTGHRFDGKRQPVDPGPNMQVIRLAIDGMMCRSCGDRIERALSSVPGVSDARVDFGIEQAILHVEAVPTETLIGVLINEGYSGHVLRDAEPFRPEGKRPRQRCCEEG